MNGKCNNFPIRKKSEKSVKKLKFTEMLFQMADGRCE